MRKFIPVFSLFNFGYWDLCGFLKFGFLMLICPAKWRD
jgi:hypothetical protein